MLKRMQKRMQKQKRKQTRKQTRKQKNRKHRQTKRQQGGDTTKTMNGTAIDPDIAIITTNDGRSMKYDDYMKHAEDMDRQGSR